MADARKAILDGFGSIKDALKKDSRPQLISRDDRLENMEKRQRKVMKQLREAIAADDPCNVAVLDAGQGQDRPPDRAPAGRPRGRPSV